MTHTRQGTYEDLVTEISLHKAVGGWCPRCAERSPCDAKIWLEEAMGALGRKLSRHQAGSNEGDSNG